MSKDRACPVTATQHKYQEAEYFLTKMLDHYHNPWEFQFNLNAFIQAFRNITFMLQSEPIKPTGFEDWYEMKRTEMRESVLLRNLVNARNVVVKQSSLSSKSRALSGMFRGYKMKIAIEHDLPVFTSTIEALEQAKKFAIGTSLDEEHSALGEQVGVERTWIVEEIGDSEVIGLCIEAMNFMGNLIAEVHHLAGVEATHDDLSVPMERVQILLETDVDPSLIEQWGW